eukprot:PhM_4_TR15190/c0_g1_i3/m.93778
MDSFMNNNKNNNNSISPFLSGSVFCNHPATTSIAPFYSSSPFSMSSLRGQAPPSPPSSPSTTHPTVVEEIDDKSDDSNKTTITGWLKDATSAPPTPPPLSLPILLPCAPFRSMLSYLHRMVFPDANCQERTSLLTMNNKNMQDEQTDETQPKPPLMIQWHDEVLPEPVVSEHKRGNASCLHGPTPKRRVLSMDTAPRCRFYPPAPSSQSSSQLKKMTREEHDAIEAEDALLSDAFSMAIETSSALSSDSKRRLQVPTTKTTTTPPAAAAGALPTTPKKAAPSSDEEVAQDAATPTGSSNIAVEHLPHKQRIVVKRSRYDFDNNNNEDDDDDDDDDEFCPIRRAVASR